MVAPFTSVQCWGVAAVDTAGSTTQIIDPSAALLKNAAPIQAVQSKTGIGCSVSRKVSGPWCAPDRSNGVFGAGARGVAWPCPSRVDDA